MSVWWDDKYMRYFGILVWAQNSFVCLALLTPLHSISSKSMLSAMFFFFLVLQLTYSMTRFAIYETVRDSVADGMQGPMPFYQKVLLASFGGIPTMECRMYQKQCLHLINIIQL